MRLCTIPGCQIEVHARGLCQPHYGLEWNRGTWSSDDRPALRLPIGWQTPDGPMPYSRELRDYRAVMERVDRARDERDYACWPEMAAAYEREVARWRADGEQVAA